MQDIAQKQISLKKATRTGSGTESGFGGEISGSGKKIRIRNTGPYIVKVTYSQFLE
jgi:hypothetical protein